VKGILNKLTPEKFERLLNQLLSVITTADILKHTITLVFENAVAQPTFCAMYADLCLSLSRELPSFPPAEGEDKPVMFKRVLLNTCQDEFEGAAEAREVSAASTGTPIGCRRHEAQGCWRFQQCICLSLCTG
jgi:translation initiation factor 4G